MPPRHARTTRGFSACRTKLSNYLLTTEDRYKGDLNLRNPSLRRQAAEFSRVLGSAVKTRLVSEANDFLPILDGLRKPGIRHIKSRGTPYRSLFLEHLLDKSRRAPAHPAFLVGNNRMLAEPFPSPERSR
jgi:hypothetical protein